MSALLIFMAAQAAVPQTSIIRKPVMESRLVIPDEIAPAVLPYLGCLMARDGVRIRGGIDPRPEGVGPGADCTLYRSTAAQDADLILTRLGRLGPQGRAQLIESTLSSIDNFSRPQPPHAAGSDADAQD
ncbi:MAG TPA: hypothetical protein VEW25_11310 [Allosphingosinicella sp.]|nr:hypothetical protein [Allosphingosinicella sp.]